MSRGRTLLGLIADLPKGDRNKLAPVVPMLLKVLDGTDWPSVDKTLSGEEPRRRGQVGLVANRAERLLEAIGKLDEETLWWLQTEHRADLSAVSDGLSSAVRGCRELAARLRGQSGQPPKLAARALAGLVCMAMDDCAVRYSRTSEGFLTRVMCAVYTAAGLQVGEPVTRYLKKTRMERALRTIQEQARERRSQRGARSRKEPH